MDEHVFRDPSRAGIFHVSKDEGASVVSAASKAGLRVVQIDVGQLGDRDEVLANLGRTLDFPDWYGANFDALHDCLTDPDWQPAPGHVLLISGLEKLRAAVPTDFHTLIDVLRSAAEIRRNLGTPLWVLLDATEPVIPSLPNA